jgi:hypothetical protein
MFVLRIAPVNQILQFKLGRIFWRLFWSRLSGRREPSGELDHQESAYQ